MMNKLIVVYFAYINTKSNWRSIISGQINYLKKIKLYDEAEIYIHITDSIHIETSVEFVKQLCPKSIISKSTVNEYEYRPLKLCYDLAIKNPDSILIYFHTKGMSYNIQKRAPIEIVLLEETFKNWKNVVATMSNSSKINKAGLFHYYKGEHIWYNFWYAKANYICKLEEPLKTEDRFYYEWWLGKTKDANYSHQDSLSILNHVGIDNDTSAKIINRIKNKRFFLNHITNLLKEKQHQIKKKIINLKYKHLVL